MIKIGITGSISSGKTTASKILSYQRGPLFSADREIKKFYANKSFKKEIIKNFSIKGKSNFKISLRNKIIKDVKNIIKLEKIIHPMVRKKMKMFSFLHKKKNLVFYEIPLLIENQLMNYFDIIIFIKAKKTIRFKRFSSRGGNKKLFNFLDKRQLSDIKKIEFSDYVVKNEKSFQFLKKNLLDIIKMYK